MAWSHGQKSLNQMLFRTLECHVAEWPEATFDEVLDVLDAIRHGVEVQRRTADRPTLKRPPEE